jgi:hypothetical protein
VENENRRPVVAQILDNLAFWLLVATAIGFLYAVWASFEILNLYVGPLVPYTPFAVPGR